VKAIKAKDKKETRERQQRTRKLNSLDNSGIKRNERKEEIQSEMNKNRRKMKEL
jgi:hypothetical protein